MNNKTSYIHHFAQISDCHLYEEKKALHYGVNVFDNLCHVLTHIKEENIADFIIFTGDLTQDHSEQSYQNFIDAVKVTKTNIPIYFLAGNHDEPELLNKYLKHAPFIQEKIIELPYWQLILVNSKSETPSGFVSSCESEYLLKSLDDTKNQLLLMHHHPMNVDYFIDKHGLQNQQTFYQTLDKIKGFRGVSCGHVHNAIELSLNINNKNMPLFTCPATSIQFKKSSSLENSGKPAGYRAFMLGKNGIIKSKAIFI
ncbi:MAG: metallophosphoesterase [Colwelliaceae bacterium]|nr:metallophosphoesterase [Colwelliaceae bacterium]